MNLMTPELQSAAAALKATGDAVKDHLVERDEVIDLVLASIVAESNIFLCGQPGIAKSAVFGDVFARISGARKGFFALTKASVPDMLVGPMSIKAMTEDDRIRHNTEGMLPDVHLAFVDEVFKGNALTRNSLLTILNERTFYNGGVPEKTPLIMAAAASNEYPDTHEDAAFWDRFIVRFHVERIADRANRRKMIRAGLKRGRGFVEGQETISLDQIRLLTQARADVVLPDPVLDTLDELIAVLVQADLEAAVGDRRLKESMYLVAAKALLAGRDTVTVDDLGVLAHTFWSTPDTRRDVQKLVHKVVSPHLASITDIFDAIVEKYEEFLKVVAETNAKPDHKRKMAANNEFYNASTSAINEMGRAIVEIEKTGRDATSGREMLAKAKAMVQDANSLAIVAPDPTIADESAA